MRVRRTPEVEARASAIWLYPRCCPDASRLGFEVPGKCPYCGQQVGPKTQMTKEQIIKSAQERIDKLRPFIGFELTIDDFVSEVMEIVGDSIDSVDRSESVNASASKDMS